MPRTSDRSSVSAAADEARASARMALGMGQAGPDRLQFPGTLVKPRLRRRAEEPARCRPEDPPGERRDDQAGGEHTDPVSQRPRRHRQVHPCGQAKPRQGGNRHDGHGGDEKPDRVPAQLRILGAGEYPAPASRFPLGLLVLIAVPSVAGGHADDRRRGAIQHRAQANGAGAEKDGGGGCNATGCRRVGRRPRACPYGR